MTAEVQPDPAGFDDELDQALAVLKRQTLPAPRDWISSSDLSRNLRDQHGLNIHWRTVDRLFRDDPTLVARRKRGQKWEYKILAGGESRVLAVAEREKSFSRLARVHAPASLCAGVARR